MTETVARLLLAVPEASVTKHHAVTLPATGDDAWNVGAVPTTNVSGDRHS